MHRREQLIYMNLQNVTLVLLTVAAVCTDLRSGKVPNSIIASGLACGVIGNICFQGWPGLWQSLAGAALPMLLLPLFYYHMIGAGDIKLLSMTGALTGPACAYRIIICTFLIGGIVSAILLIQRGTFHSRFHYFLEYIDELKRKKTPVPYLDGVSDDGKFCFTVPVLLAVLWILSAGPASGTCP